MFTPKSFPIKLNDSTTELEEEAKSFQSALLTRGMHKTGRVKNFRNMILERPKNPYSTRATEVLAKAILMNPLQSHGSWGVIVSDEDLYRDGLATRLYVCMPDETVVILYVYSDLSCTITLPTDREEIVRAVTLPFKMISARMMHRSKTGALKVSVKGGGGLTNKYVYLQAGSGRAEKIDINKPNHAEFIQDLGYEIEAILSEIPLAAPVYDIKLVDIPKDSSGGEYLWVNVSAELTKGINAGQLSWLMRGNITIHDVHLQFVKADVDTLLRLRELCDILAGLAKLKAGLSGKRMERHLMLNSSNPISGTNRMLLILQTFQGLLAEECQEEDGVAVSDEDYIAFIDAFSKLFQEKAEFCAQALDGYLYLFGTGKPGSWVPFNMATVHLSQLRDDVPAEILEARAEFQARRLKQAWEKCTIR